MQTRCPLPVSATKLIPSCQRTVQSIAFTPEFDADILAAAPKVGYGVAQTFPNRSPFVDQLREKIEKTYSHISRIYNLIFNKIMRLYVSGG
jgi:hypothetical protein